LLEIHSPLPSPKFVAPKKQLSFYDNQNHHVTIMGRIDGAIVAAVEAIVAQTGRL